MAKYSEAQNKASQRYQKKAYDVYNLRVPKGYKEDTLKPAAEAAGESVNGYIKKAIAQRIERESAEND